MEARNLRLVDDVVRAIENSILSGEMTPGDRLLVVPLAQQFGMSQSTVREALLMLERRGLVKVRPRRGAFVTRLSGDEAFELCQARALIEGFALSKGMHKMTDQALAALRGHIDVMRRCTLPRDLPTIIQSDIAFHRIIASLCESDMMMEMWSSLNGRMGALIMSSFDRRQLVTNEIADFHMDVVRALEAGDTTAAVREITAHYTRNFPQSALVADAILATTKQNE